MSGSISGIHHVTTIAGDPQANIDFYSGTLGLHLVKLTVNFDHPGTYHRYYGDGAGTPGASGTTGAAGGGMREPIASPRHMRQLARILERGGAEIALHWHQGGHELGQDDLDSASWIAIARNRGTYAKARTSTNIAIDPAVGIGHVHLKVADLERSIEFYSGVLGFEVTQRFGSQAAFLSAGGYHHHIGLNTWESLGESPPPRGHTGLYHVAFRYPGRGPLARALRRLLEAGIRLDGASDHGVSEALYLRDPDGNGVELYWDRPKDQWPHTADGGLAMYTRPLDLRGLLAEAARAPGAEHISDPGSGPIDL